MDGMNQHGEAAEHDGLVPGVQARSANLLPLRRGDEQDDEGGEGEHRRQVACCGRETQPKAKAELCVLCDLRSPSC
jgi:hypothetical protein